MQQSTWAFQDPLRNVSGLARPLFHHLCEEEKKVMTVRGSVSRYCACDLKTKCCNDHDIDIYIYIYRERGREIDRHISIDRDI